MLFFVIPGGAIRGQDRYVYKEAPLKEAITDIEQRGDYRFLYRDALVAGKVLTLDTSEERLPESMEDALRSQRVRLMYDDRYRQIMLSDAGASPPTRSYVITGHVLDHDTGARLPFANVFRQRDDGHLEGVATNASGFFQFQITNAFPERDECVLTVSYLGYHPQQVNINFSQVPADLSIRLQPLTIQTNEVLVSSSILDTDLDTTWHHLLNPGLFAPFGERSVIRSLHALPAVALSTAISDGLNVRGSKVDGFQVLLDGAPIFNQNHFYGMFDAFNADALQTVGFYYDIAPARFFGPPGGTLSFITRSGSVTDFHGTFAASNTSLRGTIEGPLERGKSSWLISGRHSYLDAVEWFNNQELVGIGLESDRELGELPPQAAPVQDIALTPISSRARFFDLHGKLSSESKRGLRATLSVYAGGNDTELVASRVSIERSEDNNRLQSVTRSGNTTNTWGNEAVSLQLQHPIWKQSYLQTTLAASHYNSSYVEEDFVYARVNPRTDRVRNFVFPFSYDNELYDISLSQHLDLATRTPGYWSAGASAHYYALRYEEQSASRPAFGEDYYALQVDAYGEYERGTNVFNLRAGLRGLFYSQGRLIRLSPRIQWTLLPGARASLRIGYSRNYQFLNQLYLENTNSSSVWVLTTGSQGPGSVDNLTAGLYLKITGTSFMQVEGYYRWHEKMRRHEINAPVQRTSSNSQNFVPWFSNNDARSRGIEGMFRQRIGPLLWSHSYTLSNVELQNADIYDGEWFPAEWDRRHQYTTTAQFDVTDWLSANLSWFYATGNPDVLTYSSDAPPERLPDHHRMDASVQVHKRLPSATLQLTLAAYNLYDADNTWYREQTRIFNPDRPARGTTFIPVDVFDLGFQPSFDLSISF